MTGTVPPSGIVLYAKQRGPTSFSSLNSIKRTFSTKKVGHTGTLDSFAEGLLVVMVGNLTRLASHVTLFDKTYEAVIALGTETDTLDPLGTIVQKASLPFQIDFELAVQKFTGNIMQTPPQYSAIHVNGKRASDLARSGKIADIPSRQVTVYCAKILDTQLVEGRVAYASMSFHVSKGTYIRCLARDIANECGSAAHLIALRRTAVGSFSLADAAGSDLLADFTIENAVQALQTDKNTDGEKLPANTCEPSQEKISEAITYMTPSFAQECGFVPVVLKDAHHFDYFNGKPLNRMMFENMKSSTIDDAESVQYAVFTQNRQFAGVIKEHFPDKSLLSYAFVIPL